MVCPFTYAHLYSGFFDGEGCFLLERKLKQGKVVQLTPKIQVGVREDDDSTILEIKRILNCGVVNSQPQSKNSRKNSKPTITFRVQDLDSLYNVVVDLFNRYPLRTKKAREFKAWSDVVCLRWAETEEGTKNSEYSSKYLALFEEAKSVLDATRRYPDRIIMTRNDGKGK